MNVLMITEFFPTGKELKFSGGVEARTFFVAKHLAQKNNVSVICTRQPNSLSFEKISGISINRVGPQISYYATGKLADVFSVLKFIKEAIDCGSKLKPDIVEGNNFLCHLIAKQISLKVKKPLVFWYPDVFIGQWIKASGLIVGLSGWALEKLNLLRGADYYITISKSSKDKLLKVGVDKSKLKIITCGIDNKEFETKVAKKKLNNIICISRLVSYKRIEDLVWAFCLLNKKGYKNINLTIVGRGPEKEKLTKIVEMTNVSSKVNFVSNLSRNALIKLLKSSQLFCLPSEIEGFGIAVIEAAAAGIPFVISDIKVFKEITKNGQGGVFFKLGNIKDLASKIELLLSDPTLYWQKVKEGPLLAKNYNWDEISAETEKVYISLL